MLPLPIPLPPVTVTATATITTSTKTHVYYITSSTLSFPALLKAIFLRGWKKASCDSISLPVARRWFRNGCAAEGLKRAIRPPGHESGIKQLLLTIDIPKQADQQLSAVLDYCLQARFATVS